MSDFGIYFGTEVINIIELKGKKILASLSIPKAGSIKSNLEQKTPDLAGLVSSLKAEFTKNEISPSNACIALAGENLIIRTFDLPIFLSKKELDYDTITFEARKYIPFKIEDLIFDYRFYFDKKDKKIFVLFMGIKNENLNFYLSIFEQLQIEAMLIEYAGFSILRLLKLGALSDKGIIGIINADSEEETNFLVCQDGFPLFTRDISFALGKKPEVKANFIAKLKSEIRISLDFFRRKFATKLLKRVIILSAPEFQEEITALTNDLGLSPIYLKTSKFLGVDTEFSCALGKSFAVAISSTQKMRYSIDFLKPITKKEPQKKALSLKAIPISVSALKINSKVAWIAFLIVFLSLGWSWLRRAPLENELKLLVANQPQVAGLVGSSSYSSLANIETDIINRTRTMKEAIKNRYYFTVALNAIPRLMSDGAWLVSLNYRYADDVLEISLEGMVFLNDQDKEFAAVNEILLGLRNSPDFNQRFEEIKVVSMERIQSIDRTQYGAQKLEVTKFNIICRSKTK